MPTIKSLIRGRARLLFFHLLVLRGQFARVAAFEGTECGGTYSGMRYFITSPNYPGNYPANQNCRYVLTTPRDSICEPGFRLTFATFSIESSTNCTKDYLRIVESGSNGSWSSGDICGNVAGSKDLRGRRGSDPEIIFHSDEDAGDKGFKILVETIPCRENGVVIQAQDRVSYASHRPEVEFETEDVEAVPLPPKITSYLYLPAETEGNDAARTLKTGSKHRPHRFQNSTKKPATLPENTNSQHEANSSWTIHALQTDLQLPTANEPVVFRENKVEPQKIIGSSPSIVHGTPATAYGVPQNPTNSFDPLANERPNQHPNCNGRDDGFGTGIFYPHANNYPNTNNFPTFNQYPNYPNNYPNSNDYPNSNNVPNTNNYPNVNNYPNTNGYPNANNYPNGNYPGTNYPNPNNYPNGGGYPTSVGNCRNERPDATTPRPGNNYYPRSNCGGDTNWNIVPSTNGGNFDGQPPFDGSNWNDDNGSIGPTSGYDWSFSVNTNVGPSGYVPSRTNYIPFTTSSLECCGTVYSSDNFYLTSPGFPALTHSSTNYDCQYTIQRTSASVCAVTLNFRYFYFGAEDQFCTYGYIEVDDQRYCGCRTGTNVTLFFDDLYTKVIKVRYLGYPRIKFNGFFIQVNQASCSTTYSRSRDISRTIAARADDDRANRGRRSPQTNIDDTTRTEKRQLGYEYQRPSAQLSVLENFLPTLPTSCQALKFFNWVVAAKQVYLRNARCSNRATSTATLVSVVPILPIFPTADHAGIFGVQGTTPASCDEINVTEGTIASPYHPANYANNLIRCYRFRKAPGYCQLELAMLDFDLESSSGCRKDFVTFGGQSRRYCGNSLAGSRAIIDLSTISTADLYFVTDSTGTGRGFRAGFSQIPC